MVDPLLSKYSVLMIDEAHERSAYTDLLLGILKKSVPLCSATLDLILIFVAGRIRKKRPDLRLIISSATIDAQAFLNYFNSNVDSSDRTQDDATIISLEGRTYPVEISYLDQPVSDYVQAAADTVLKLHVHQPLGDVLVFMTGREEIDACAQEIADRTHDLPKGTYRLSPLPLHAGLSTEQQLEVFQPAPQNTRKVVISTNIAEASVTIEGVKYVVDCGFVKVRSMPSPLFN